MKKELILTVQYGNEITASNHKALPNRKLIARWITPVLIKDAKLKKLNVRFVGKKEGFSLNKNYRYKAYATNILTFTYSVPNEKIISDLILCCPVIENEAKNQYKTLTAHYAHLLIHGALHAQGYDHEKSYEDRRSMEFLEIEILACFGFQNPYL